MMVNWTPLTLLRLPIGIVEIYAGNEGREGRVGLWQ